MTDIVENWMHASDEEREQIHQGWNPVAGDGKKIVDEVAKLFKNECIYGIVEAEVTHDDDRWSIKAYFEPEDYENLKNRYNIEFLGFKINFHDVNER